MRLALLVIVLTACVVPEQPKQQLLTQVAADSGQPMVDAGPCAVESSQETCIRLSLGCGMMDAVDNCGTGIRVDCACGSDGGLSACGPGETLCDGGCTNTSTDPFNCIECGIACETGRGATCGGSPTPTCNYACRQGELFCGISVSGTPICVSDGGC